MSIGKIGILSLGDMGAGVARILAANGFQTVSNCTGRSPDTVLRAQSAGVDLVPTDTALVSTCSIILSILPPGDASALADRIVSALSTSPRPAHAAPLVYLDLNALAPSSVRAINTRLTAAGVVFLDGAILGGPPSCGADGVWKCPRMPLSGPRSLQDLFPGEGGARLAQTLNMYHVSRDIGAASGLKMCFSTISKGVVALFTQAFTTAHHLGMTESLKEELGILFPRQLKYAEGNGVSTMPPKAYRWIAEMQEIAKTHKEELGFSPELFNGAASVFANVASDSILGEEKIGRRNRGQTTEDVAAVLAQDLLKKKQKKANIHPDKAE
ncbi:hypothetical protein TD95_002662 [Thielaviopsis punctulata]|uniref:Phosphogluconate dehydrogenase NAD-binding putative C-terminal domain-containing protein n=1 Tax=Thielaviopsis punctulata TaxID=72032 RepID=A0A0F4ZKK9_9PEZI|nr:hypothetical protein TD95_002662 [Thielaviopsis punctulata]